MGDTVEREKAAVTAAIVEEEDESSSEVLRWEKFSPRMVLRVLLVEADDSTRQIISALLRKCNYKVAAVPDGLMAWETLKGRPHSIDLILTEVELPSISGYALLTLVMDHDICKNIPVIMMSLQDSINMVLKCMLKGAADFLIKPVKRNELKNLWQHVWRRRTLNAGQIPQSSPIVQHQTEATSENNGSSTHSTGCPTSPWKDKEFDKNWSNSQSSCTTPYLEAESAQMQNLQGLLEPKHRRASTESDILTEKCEELEKLDNKSDKPKSEIEGMSNDWGAKGEDPSRNATGLTVEKECSSLKTLIQNEKTRPENDGEHPHYHSDEPVESSRRAIDLIGTFDNSAKRLYGLMELQDGTSKFDFSPKLDLCLSNSGNQVGDERHRLNHSDGSAFSWYNSTQLRALFPMSSSNYVKEDNCKSAEPCLKKFSPNVNQKENSTSMIEKKKVTTTTIISQQGKPDLAYPTPQIQFFPFPGVTFEKVSAEYGHAVPPVSWGPKLASLREQSPLPTSASVHSNHEVRGSEKNYRQSDETTVNSVDQHKHSENFTKPEQEVRCDSSAGAQSTSSRCNSVPNCNSSCAHGSSLTRYDGCYLPATVEKTRALDSLKDSSLLVSDGIMGTSVHQSTQREEALTKFRMKRKERCYGKKVRYQSRKRLAEQRPRVKGQFVRQVQNDALSNADG